MITPDLAWPMRGHRVWGVVATAQGLRLVSVAAAPWAPAPVWPPLDRFVACCLAPRSCGAAPGPSHGCGIHAFRRRGDAEAWARSMARIRPVIVGEVLLWGVVVEAERGFRAEFAYPAGLHGVLGRRREGVDLDALRAGYGLPA